MRDKKLRKVVSSCSELKRVSLTTVLEAEHDPEEEVVSILIIEIHLTLFYGTEPTNLRSASIVDVHKTLQ